MIERNKVLANIKHYLDTDPDFAEGFKAYKDGRANSENPYPHPSNMSAMHIAWSLGYGAGITEEVLLSEVLTPCGK